MMSHDVTVDLFGSESYGTVAAFGDFNSDKQTDIFIIRKQSELVIFLADLKAPYFKPKVHIPKEQFPRDFTISSVVPGDYDGDSKMDVLITAHPNDKGISETSVIVFWGNNQTLDAGERIELNKTFTDEPLVMDFNGDMVPDIFGVIDGVTRVCYLKGRKMVWQQGLGSNVKMHIPHSNAFIDLNQDFTADLFLTTSDSDASALAPVTFETWINKDGNFTKTSAGKTLDIFKIVGQSAFIDFDGDGKQDQLLPVCMDTACQRSAIYLSKGGDSEWLPILTEFQKKDTVWGFVPPSVGELHAPITLHLGDYNLDGFPDALAILRNTSGRHLITLQSYVCFSEAAASGPRGPNAPAGPSGSRGPPSPLSAGPRGSFRAFREELQSFTRKTFVLGCRSLPILPLPRPP
ncbi:hypothetical protein COCON_G00102520 [Conger conger]|uniref:T-cell immunomodulatory protein n=1 Tax=Conger conger TaxID=82655 RepID=A0A9Q1HYN0_CONCO|nr:hypothetical protein COCON_G00102520 [Conger conger]